MRAEVISVNTGGLQPLPGHPRPTGIRKHPVAQISVRDPGPKQGGLGSGVIGDHIGSRKHHGGETQAVYAVAREELDWWAQELGRELPDGMFGENLTTRGVEVDEARLGELWRVGTALLEVCGPRIPCGTFAVHMGEERWVKRFAARGRVGAYLAVAEAGVVEPGDPIEVIERPDHDLSVTAFFRAATGDKELAASILDAGVLRPIEHAWLESRG